MGRRVRGEIRILLAADASLLPTSREQELIVLTVALPVSPRMANGFARRSKPKVRQHRVSASFVPRKDSIVPEEF